MHIFLFILSTAFQYCPNHRGLRVNKNKQTLKPQNHNQNNKKIINLASNTWLQEQDYKLDSKTTERGLFSVPSLILKGEGAITLRGGQDVS